MELLDSLTQSCIELGSTLERYGLVQAIKMTRYNDDYIRATEADQEFLDKEIAELENILDELLKEYNSRLTEAESLAA